MRRVRQCVVRGALDVILEVAEEGDKEEEEPR